MSNRVLNTPLYQYLCNKQPINWFCCRWHAMCPLKNYITPVLTASAGDIMLYLKDQLYALESKLCSDIFQEIWKSVAKKIDVLIFDAVRGLCIYRYFPFCTTFYLLHTISKPRHSWPIENYNYPKNIWTGKILCKANQGDKFSDVLFFKKN